MARTAITGPYRQTVGNLIKNGDFEYAPTFTAAQTTGGNWIDGTATGSGSNPSYGWALFSASGTVSTQFDSAVKYSGSNSLRVSTTATASAIEAMSAPATSATIIKRYGIPILPSTSYTVTYKMKTNRTSGSATTGALVYANERNVAGTAVASNAGTSVTTTTDWTSYSISFTTNSAARFLTIKCTVLGSDGTGTLIMDAWVDDITLTKTTPETRTAAGTRTVATGRSVA